jgi:hypothetical protein
MSETQHRRGAGDVPPHGKELDADQKLRPSQEMSRDSEVYHDGKATNRMMRAGFIGVSFLLVQQW